MLSNPDQLKLTTEALELIAAVIGVLVAVWAKSGSQNNGARDDSCSKHCDNDK